jgi:hypothetical protein
LLKRKTAVKIEDAETHGSPVLRRLRRSTVASDIIKPCRLYLDHSFMSAFPFLQSVIPGILANSATPIAAALDFVAEFARIPGMAQ